MKMPRMFWWWVLTVISGLGVYYVSPQQFPVTLYKFSLVTVAAIMAYWLDRTLFAESWPRLSIEMPRDLVTASRVLARALIYLGTVLGVTLGL